MDAYATGMHDCNYNTHTTRKHIAAAKPDTWLQQREGRQDTKGALLHREFFLLEPH